MRRNQFSTETNNNKYGCYHEIRISTWVGSSFELDILRWTFEFLLFVFRFIHRETGRTPIWFCFCFCFVIESCIFAWLRVCVHAHVCVGIVFEFGFLYICVCSYSGARKADSFSVCHGMCIDFSLCLCVALFWIWGFHHHLADTHSHGNWAAVGHSNVCIQVSVKILWEFIQQQQQPQQQQRCNHINMANISIWKSMQQYDTLGIFVGISAFHISVFPLFIFAHTRQIKKRTWKHQQQLTATVPFQHTKPRE